jgi:hypothetical protein
MTKDEFKQYNMFASIFEDFKDKVSEENERRVLDCLRTNFKRSIEVLKTLIPQKEILLKELTHSDKESDSVVYENIWALNNERLRILENNLKFVNT